MAIDPITAGAIIQGGFNIGSTLLGGSISSSNTAKQIAFEKWKMANAHQMEIRDLEAAGLNPILSAGGSGASAGSITPQMPDISGIKEAGTAIFKAITAKNETDQKNADVSLKKSQETNTDVDTTVKAAQAGLTDATTAKTIIETKLKEAENEKIKEKIQAEIDNLKIQAEAMKQEIKESTSRIDKIKAENKIIEIEEKIKEKENKWFHVNQVLGGIGKIAGIATGALGVATARKIGDQIVKKQHAMKWNTFRE